MFDPFERRHDGKTIRVRDRKPAPSESQSKGELTDPRIVC